MLDLCLNNGPESWWSFLGAWRETILWNSLNFRGFEVTASQPTSIEIHNFRRFLLKFSNIFQLQPKSVPPSSPQEVSAVCKSSEKS
jgi:hypothetical protein